MNRQQVVHPFKHWFMLSKNEWKKNQEWKAIISILVSQQNEFYYGRKKKEKTQNRNEEEHRTSQRALETESQTVSLIKQWVMKVPEAVDK